MPVDPHLNEPETRRKDGLTWKDGAWTRLHGVQEGLLKVACGSPRRRRTWRAKNGDRWPLRCRETVGLFENGRCRLHGGPTPTGLDHPATKIENWLANLPPRIRDYLNTARSDQAPASMIDYLYLTDARIMELVARLKDGGGEDWIRRLKEGADALRAAEVPDGADALSEAVGLCLAAIDDGASYEATWTQILDTAEQRRKFSETVTKERAQMKLLVPIENVLIFFAFLKVVIRKRVEDEAIRKLLADDLRPLRTMVSFGSVTKGKA